MRHREPPNEDEEEAVLNVSIVGDEEEQRRVELEQNLQDISIQLSLSTQSHNEDAESSGEVEYPRHDPNPRDMSIYRGHSSLGDVTPMDNDFDPNPYSYHTLNNDDTSHYGGNTMSTAAHHASAVTLSAGLGGRTGKRHYPIEASLSGAEYDPDRPLDVVVNGMADELSMLNMKPSRNVSKAVKQTEPLKPLKKSVQTNFAIRHQPRAEIRPSQSDHHPQVSILRPKPIKARLRSDAPLQRQAELSFARATPGSYTSNATGGSKFTRLAKTLAKEIEASHRWATAPEMDSPERPLRKKQASKPKRAPTNRKTYAEDAEQLNSVYLPDVTGLTSAVGSPPRKDRGWRRYAGGDEDDDRIEVKLVQALSSLQMRLNQLESQNLTSRRRIRELELELETCKLEVKRERTRALEKEEIIVAQQRDFQKKRQKRTTFDGEDRYREVVEEKKALEALISTLRSHLSRTTDELARQQEQLNVLQSLRQIDAQGLEQKLATIEALKAEIERIGQEVETLRGVVEEGLSERKRAKEGASSLNASVMSDGFMDGPPRRNAPNTSFDTSREVRGDPRQDIPSPPPSRPSSPRLNRPERKDKGKLRFSVRPAPKAQDRFIDDDELERVSAELEERRSVRSESNDSNSFERRGPAAPTESRRTKVERNDDRKAQARHSGKQAKDDGVFPKIRSRRAEQLFSSAPAHNEQTCRLCHRRQRPGHGIDDFDFPSFLPPRKRARLSHDDTRSQRRPSDFDENEGRLPFAKEQLPPQTVLARVLGELEDEFAHYKGIYCELAEQYNLMDAVSNVPKRNALADHLREVVDSLEQRGDQIASLYELLSYKDKPEESAKAPQGSRIRTSPRRSRKSRV